jgi:hypothetical protein
MNRGGVVHVFPSSSGNVSAASKESITNTRNLINSPSFDPTQYLESQIALISVEGGDAEKNLFNLFDTFSRHLYELNHALDEEFDTIQEVAHNMETMLYEELYEHSVKLQEVHQAVDAVKVNFDRASENALRIGTRLQISERERINIVKSVELLMYIREFQRTPDTIADNISSMNAVTLKDSLPKTLTSKNWNEISKILHDLKIILNDLNSEDVQKAQKMITNITEVVESELLGQFDIILNQLMENTNYYQSPQSKNTDETPISTSDEPSGSSNNGLGMKYDPNLLERAQVLTSCLHLFNNGQSLQKRYIFSVIQRRIPNEIISLALNKNSGNKGLQVLKLIKDKVIQKVVQVGQGFGDDDNEGDSGSDNGHGHDDDNSSGGASDEDGSDDEGDRETRQKQRHHHNHRNNSPNSTNKGMTSNGSDDNVFLKAKQNILTIANNTAATLQTHLGLDGRLGNDDEELLDHLSNLFSIIDKVCREQFELIRQVFPPHTIARVTRLLVQRIFGDPAFGIQAKVDAILSPQPPSPPLPLADFLDALLTVREKLSALNLMLVECSLDPALMGMGSETESLRRSKNEIWKANLLRNSDRTNHSSLTKHGETGENEETALLTNGLHESDEKVKSDAEIRDFLDEQVSRLFLISYSHIMS